MNAFVAEHKSIKFLLKAKSYCYLDYGAPLVGGHHLVYKEISAIRV